MSLPRNVCFPGSNISLCVLSFSPYLLCNMSFFSLCDNISSSFLFIIWSNQCMLFQRKQSKGGVIQPVTAEIEPLEGTSPGLTTCRLFMAALVWSQRQSVYYCIFSKNLQGIHQSVRNGACIKNKSYYEIPLFFFFFWVVECVVRVLQCHCSVLSFTSYPGSCDVEPTLALLARRLLNSRNDTVDPCEDFYKYACGRWDGKHSSTEVSRNIFDMLLEENQLILKRLLGRKRWLVWYFQHCQRWEYQ